jgi:hypothetical protein
VAAAKASNPGADVSGLSDFFHRVDPDGRIEVCVVGATATSELLPKLRAAGLNIETGMDSGNVVLGWVSYAVIDALAKVPGVSEVGFPTYAIADAGDYTTAGDQILNADDLRSLTGVDGTGAGDPTEFYVPFVPTHVDVDPVIRRNVLDLAAAIADMKRIDPNADASVLSFDGISAKHVTPSGEMLVEIRFESAQTDILAYLESLGFRPETFRQSGVPATQGTTTGWVSYAALRSLGELTGVLEISLPLAPVSRTGSVTTVGDGILNADDLRSLMSVDGTGVKVGVISNGADHSQDIADFGDLPESINIDSTRQGAGDEGTAMMEIVYDMAPGAELYFSGPGNADQMVDSIGWLVGQGCDIIVDDQGFYDQPMFQDGTVAQAALDAIEDGVTYVSAAGNDAETHYQAAFNPALDDTHLFAQNQNLLRFYLDAHSSVTGVLQWSDEWGYSSNDYDLVLYQWTGTWNLIAASAEVQDGNDTPFESVAWTNPNAGAVLLAWQIQRFDGAVRELELYTMGDVLPYGYDAQLFIPGDSIFGHPAAEGVIAAGAIDAADSGNDDIEDFSSQGPATIYTDFTNQVSTTRHPLDVEGIDGISTKAGVEGYFSQPFYGTSAAAPHIAAIAALLLQIDPGLTPADIQDLITANAVDLGTTGYDDVFGFGRADALATISATTGSPDLAAASDTGTDDTDNITKLDNSAAGKELEFDVLATVVGATVKLYAGGTEIGSAVATATTTTVTTNGSADLTDGQHTITVRQTVPGKLQSPAGDGLAVTIDTTPPTVSSFVRTGNSGASWRLRPTELRGIALVFSEGVVVDDQSAHLALYNLSTQQAYNPTPPTPTYNSGTLTATWAYVGLTPTSGWYRVTLSTGVEDLAGNLLDGDNNGSAGGNYIYGLSTPDNDMLVPKAGDANLNGSVDINDMGTVEDNFGLTGATWEQGDFDYNGTVDFMDYLTLKANYGIALTR